jgi:hypothetical protein
MAEQRGPFVDPPYYAESELRGGAVTVSFSEIPPLTSDELLITLHPLLENVNGGILAPELRIRGATLPLPQYVFMA